MEVIIIMVRSPVRKLFLHALWRLDCKYADRRPGSLIAMTQHSEGRQPSEPAIYCDQSRRLLDSFGEAVQGLLILHEQQFLAIVEGDLECHRFDLLIHMANEKKQQAKYAYMQHLESHGCSLIKDVTE